MGGGEGGGPSLQARAIFVYFCESPKSTIQMAEKQSRKAVTGIQNVLKIKTRENPPCR